MNSQCTCPERCSFLTLGFEILDPIRVGGGEYITPPIEVEWISVSL